jgi:DNA-binding MarR family transcriptional regulator
VAERLRLLVDSLAVTGATDIIMNYKQKDLCSLLGTQRTTLVASLDRLQEDGIIEYDSNELRVLDVRGLLEWNK